jgi:hypothetical protein
MEEGEERMKRRKIKRKQEKEVGEEEIIRVISP